jgi:protein transport protein SEC24
LDQGVAVTGYRGPFTNDRVSDELEMCALDECSTVMVDLTVEAVLTTPTVTVQIATLYTNPAGMRCVRLHTLQLSVSSELSTNFRLADLDATVYWTASSGTALAAAQGIKSARSEVAKRTGEILSAYRTYCAKNPAPGQLILPEALKHLPACVLGLLKSSLLRPSTAITPQQRCHLLRCVVPFLPPGQLNALCYPLAIPLDQIDPESSVYGFPDPQSGQIRYPAPLRLLRSSLAPTGVTLFDDGLSLRIFFGGETVGRAAMAELITEPWAAPEVDIRACPWDAMPRESPWAQRVAAVVAARRSGDPGQFKLVRVSKVSAIASCCLC